MVYDSTASYFVDPRTISLTTSGNTIQWNGVSAPATDVEIYSGEVNGTLYDQSQNPSPPLLGG